MSDVNGFGFKRLLFWSGVYKQLIFFFFSADVIVIINYLNFYFWEKETTSADVQILHLKKSYQSTNVYFATELNPNIHLVFLLSSHGES